MVTAVKSHQEIENRVDDDEEKVGDEKNTDDVDSVSENSKKSLKGTTEEEREED